jgi:hypothetical protein
MSATKDKFHTHRSSDGLYYATYEAMRNANIRNNERRLHQLGLTRTLTRRVSSKDRRVVTTTNVVRRFPIRKEPIRRSNRIRKTTVEYPEGVEDYQHFKTQAMKRPKRITLAMAAQGPGHLSESDRHMLIEYPNWIEDMEAYLSEKENLSSQNLSSVMRQVRKLSSGIGINYHHWPENVFFAKGRCINLADDLDALYDEAVEFENKYGRDLGNGR